MNRLHPIAQAVQSQGRGKDTQLVHMTPGEVQGLQALAKAHGGSLSINPETGLVEAGFLESILPTVAGFALNAAFPGLGTLGSAALVGLGATALNKGDIEKGLMAGLGAWGGAGMAESLLGQASKAAAANVAAQQSTKLAGAGAESILNPTMSYQAPLNAGGFGSTVAPASGVSAAQTGATNQFLSNAGLGGMPQASMSPLTPIPQISTPPMSTMEQLSAGAKSAMQSPGQFLKDNWQYAGAAAAPVAMGMMTPEGTTVPADNEQFRYTYDPGRLSEEELARQREENPDGELRYFRPKYGPRQTVRVAQGGEIRYAEGGTSEYEYDPATQTYKKKPSAPVGAVPSIGVPGSGGDSGGDQAPLTKEQRDFFDKETPAERDARMGKINDFLSMLAPGSIARALVGGANSLTGGGLGDTRAPVVDRNIYTEPGRSGDSGGDSFGGDTYGGDTGYGPTGESLLAQGGLAGLAAGGISKGGFVVPADVVSALGNGSTDAGLRALNKKLAATPIKGNGDGLSDSIPTSIDGKQPARVADGEAYISPQIVAKIGGGDAKKGAKKLYAMMDRIRQQAHGKKSQQRRVNPNTAV